MTKMNSLDLAQFVRTNKIIKVTKVCKNGSEITETYSIDTPIIYIIRKLEIDKSILKVEVIDLNKGQREEQNDNCKKRSE